jgi:hypothetical protein
MLKSAPTPARQLTVLLRDYTQTVRQTAQAALTKLREQVPGATEMIYDTYNALVIGFAPGDRPSEAVLSIGLYPKWVNVYFLDGAVLDDPQKVLKGSGSRVRTLRLDDGARVLDAPAVKALVAAAVDNADAPFDATRRRRLVIKSSVAKRRPRRPRR